MSNGSFTDFLLKVANNPIGRLVLWVLSLFGRTEKNV